MNSNESLGIAIEKLDFSQHTFNFLYKVGCRTLGDITTKTLTEIGGGSKLFGKNSRSEIQDKLAEYNLPPLSN